MATLLQIDGYSQGKQIVAKGCPAVLNTIASPLSSMIEGCIRGSRDSYVFT
jgi:hypothetical protein